MQTIIDKLSNNPERRSLLKWLTVGLGIWTGSEATQGSYTALVAGLLAVLVKWLEQQSSNAARAKLEAPITDPDDYDGEPLTPPDYSKIWPQPDAPTEKLPVQIERKELFQQLGISPMPAIPAPSFPTPQEIKETEKLLEPPPPTEFFVHWYDPEEGAKTRKFTDKLEAIKYRNSKPGAMLR